MRVPCRWRERVVAVSAGAAHALLVTEATHGRGATVAGVLVLRVSRVLRHRDSSISLFSCPLPSIGRILVWLGRQGCVWTVVG